MPTTQPPWPAARPSDPQRFRIQVQKGMPVVTAPASTDANLGDIDLDEEKMRQELLAATAYGTVIVVDMSAAFCGVRGMRALAMTGKMLAHGGGEIRVVISNGATLRALAALHWDRYLRIFQSTPEALSAAMQSQAAQLGVA